MTSNFRDFFDTLTRRPPCRVAFFLCVPGGYLVNSSEEIKFRLDYGNIVCYT